MVAIDKVADTGGLAADVALMSVLADTGRDHRITVETKEAGHVEHEARPPGQLVELLRVPRVRHEQRHV